MERYVSELMETIIVKPLITKAPLQKEKKISIPASEKILVDIFVEKKIFASYQGSELVNIYNNVYKSYAFTGDKLTAFAPNTVGVRFRVEHESGGVTEKQMEIMKQYNI